MYLIIKKSPQHSSIIKVKKGINISKIRWEKKKLSIKPATNISLRIKNNRKMILNDILYLVRKFK